MFKSTYILEDSNFLEKSGRIYLILDHQIFQLLQKRSKQIFKLEEIILSKGVYNEVK